MGVKRGQKIGRCTKINGFRVSPGVISSKCLRGPNGSLHLKTGIFRSNPRAQAQGQTCQALLGLYFLTGVESKGEVPLDSHDLLRQHHSVTDGHNRKFYKHKKNAGET